MLLPMVVGKYKRDFKMENDVAAAAVKIQD
jgi:hypothetical protein